MMNETLTLITPTCICCAQPAPLLPRDDLAPGLAACQHSGQLYRPNGATYVPTTLPEIGGPPRAVTSQTIDLSQAGYA